MIEADPAEVTIQGFDREKRTTKHLNKHIIQIQPDGQVIILDPLVRSTALL